MQIDIFDVGHGACAVVTAPNGRRVMIDCGHDDERPWRPSVAFAGQEIDALFVTNYDEDHVSDLPNLLRDARVWVIVRNTTVSSRTLGQLKMEFGAGQGIERLSQWMVEAEAGRVPTYSLDNFGGMRWACHWNSYPSFDDENNLSMAVVFEWSGFRILFGGDLERAGWQQLLTRAEFTSELPHINVFVASHHGRESGCCEEVFDICRPQIVVMSDSERQHETQETSTWYSARTTGIDVASGGRRHIYTTRRDGDLSIRVDTAQWTITPGGGRRAFAEPPRLTDAIAWYLRNPPRGV